MTLASTLALEAAGIGSWEWDAASGGIAWSAVRECLFGFTPGSYDGSVAQWLAKVHPDDRYDVEQNIVRGQKDPAGGENRFSFRCRILRPDGDMRWIRERGTQIYNERRELLRTIGFCWDITEEELALRNAEASGRTQNLFLANVSHELRTPLNGVLSMADLLLESPLEEDLREYVEIIRESGELMLLVANDILDFTTIEAGKLTIYPTRFNLHRLVAHAIAAVQPQAQGKALVITHDFRGTDPSEFIGDAVRLRQVLLNYLNNAIKFTKSGSIRVEVRVEGGTSRTANVLIAVHDTGEGISAEAQATLFQPFIQLDTAKGDQRGGSGLGLALSSRITKLMGGTVGVISAPGEGSTFWLHVPLEMASEAFPEQCRKCASSAKAY